MTRQALPAVLSLLLAASSATAQTRPRAAGYLTYGANVAAAGETFEAVGAGTTHQSFGGGGTLTGVWRGLFVDVGVSGQRIAGERVFVLDGTVYPLGIPLRVTIRPIDVAGGWRIDRGRMAPYLGAGVTRVAYRERADFAQAGDDVEGSAIGGLFLAGLDVTVWKRVSIGGELRYRSVSGVLGEAGASEALGESGLGGLAAGFRISLRG